MNKTRKHHNSLLATIARVNHLIPSRTQKWNLLALMVVWRLPCESKSSPAFKSETPPPHKQRGCFLLQKRKFKSNLQNLNCFLPTSIYDWFKFIIIKRNSALNVIIQLLGGIGLFLLGMSLMTDSLKAIAGEALRQWLVRFTNSPI